MNFFRLLSIKQLATRVWSFTIIIMEDTPRCHICEKSKNQGTICYSCRAGFVTQAIGEPLDTTCDNCTGYGFPCLNCAQYTFKGTLGEGHPSPSTEEIEICVD